MARAQPHFEHHRREIQITRRRFRLTMLVLLVGLSVTVGLQFRASRAASVPEIASGITGKCLQNRGNAAGPDSDAAVLWDCSGSASQQISMTGQVVVQGSLCLATVNGSTSSGAFVHFQTCNGASGENWSRKNGTLVNVSAGKCLSGPGTAMTNGTVLELSSCNGASDQNWIPGFFVTPGGLATPAPATPTPGLKASGTGSSGGPSAAGESTAATPGAPANFSAMVSGSNAIVTLSWVASSDVSGIKAYQIDSSLDQVTWTALPNVVSGTTYVDKSAVYGVHYYYRLRALDNAGNESGFAFTDIATPTFSSNLAIDSSSTYASDDRIATVTVSGAAVASNVECSVTSDSTATVNSRQRVVAGPYALLCKDATGAPMASYNQALTWTLSLHGKLKGLTDPQAYTLDQNGDVTLVKNGKFEPKIAVLAFTTATTNDVMVLAVPAKGVAWDVIVTIAVVLLIVAGVLIAILRKQQRSRYDKYLHAKYYNL